MRPTEELKAEHGVIKRMLAVARELAARLERGEAAPPEHLAAIVEFIRGFADHCHHGKEENLLFKAMAAAGFPYDAGPLGVMRAEHEQGRALVREMDEAAAAYRRGDQGAGARFAAAARGYAGLLEQHIDKEDNILYEMADAHLSPAQQRELEAGFARVEAEEVGAGEHERLRGIVPALEAFYGPRR